ncbi:uncharacterized protein DSM5745_10194 [Aspergillus mulundensis]|uniref:Carboxylic ester hydrolase n=1 Tax=Aspergillus mulundensis TaxID=1810919 RepID=A0A3D8QMM3_9EURO|nr:hypothetical protein DSM5745_10194 [Aspergillus mulundensis]RDW63083.1 hypothetical protein DSM5745_10194 [Aspergillus mulundensis]
MHLSTSSWIAALAASQTVSSLSLASPSCHHSVTLNGYGSFCGTTISSTLSNETLPAPVDAWLGMDYATQPDGDRRFTPSTWPEPFKGIKKADTYGKGCIQDGTMFDIASQSEACLNFNVFRTKGVPLSKKLPVLVWIHGGSFNIGSWKSFDGASFAASSSEPIVVVNFHYRINSLGFLPSTLFEEEGLLNLGMRDQHLFLRFVQKHIASFGGDPDAVTIGGRSAGGHSVGIHYFHNYGPDRGKPLFARAIHQSGAVTARAFPNASYPLYQDQFAEYMSYLGCPVDGDNKAALACLRNADINQIRTVSTSIYDNSNRALTWPFQPAQGGPLLEKFGSESGMDGTFFHVPTITSSTTNEGKFYVPGDLQTNGEFLGYMHNISPALNATDLALLEALYPDPVTNEDSPYTNSPNSTQYNRLATTWSDYAYICPSQETATRASAANVPTWKLRFDTNNSFPAWQGIPHTADTKYTWDEPSTQYPEISHVYHAYLASFVVSGDPNTFRYPGAPEWPGYRPDRKTQLVVRPGNGTRAEVDDVRAEACAYWRSAERASRLNK